MMTIAQLECDLGHFGRVAHARAYAAIGGEPTMHPQIVELLSVMRASGVADKIEVWTNAERLRRLPASFWRAFDVLVVSAYPGVLTDADLAWIEGKCADEGVEYVLKDERRYPNFTRLLEASPTDDATTQAKFRACFFKDYSRVLDWGYFAKCCTSPFIPMLLQGRPFGSDMLKVDESLTEERLRAFLGDPKFMEACRICTGRNTPSATPIEWGEERDPAEWLRKSGMDG